MRLSLLGQTSTSEGVSLSHLLLLFISLYIESMVNDFQNQSLQDEWNSFRTGILERRNERHGSLTTHNAALQQQRQVRAEQSKQRTAALDEKVDSLNARFADTTVALEYDADRLNSQFQAPVAQEKVQHCLGERAHWIDCQQKYAVDSRPCNAYLVALEKCVSKRIVDSNAE